MLDYNQEVINSIAFKSLEIASFVTEHDDYIDSKTVESFGEEWEKFDDKTINEFDQGALVFWNTNKELILTAAKNKQSYEDNKK